MMDLVSEISMDQLVSFEQFKRHVVSGSHCSNPPCSRTQLGTCCLSFTRCISSNLPFPYLDYATVSVFRRRLLSGGWPNLKTTGSSSGVTIHATAADLGLH
jgi:hypothetical protein